MSYAYDNLWDLTSETDPTGATTTYAYNALGQQIVVTGQNPDPGVSGYASPVTTFNYDALGGVTREAAPQPTSGGSLDTTTYYAYDGFHRLHSVTDPNGNATTYGYDADGNQASVTDADSNTTTYQYDLQGRVTTMTDQLGNHESYTYSLTLDPSGGLTSTTDRNDQTIDYAYDNLGREKTEAWMSGGSEVQTITYGYDADGNLASATESFTFTFASPVGEEPVGIEYAYTYDHQNRVISETNAGSNIEPIVVLSTSYDDTGNRTALSATVQAHYGATTTDDFVNNFAYDNLNRLTDITQQTQSSSLTNDVVAPKHVALGYDDSGLQQSIDRYASTTTSSDVANRAYAYDHAGRLTTLTTDLTGGSATLTYGWAYDAANLVTSFTSAADGTATYAYDNSGQIKTADYSTGYTGTPTNESYTFDANGNRNNSGFTVSTAGTHGANQLSSDGTWTYTYDDNGNLTRQQNSGGEIDYTYDYRNRLIRIQDKNSSSQVTEEIDYVYDMFNRLLLRLSASYGDDGDGGWIYMSGTTAEYSYDGNNMVLTFNSSGGVTDRYLWNPGTTQLLADEQVTTITAAGTTVWAIGDNENSVRDLLEYNSGAGTTSVVGHYAYKSFGQVIAHSSLASTFTYAGAFTDAVTGFQDDVNRWYDPANQRWMSQDPINADINTYCYTGNSPTTYTDPNGLYGIAGHFYGTFIGLRLGGMDVQSAYELAYDAQLPDQLKYTDATELAKTWVAAEANLAFADEENLPDALLEEAEARNNYIDSANWLHSLHGGDYAAIEARRSCIRKLLQTPNLKTWVKGFLIHALGDSYAHTYVDGSGFRAAYNATALDGNIPWGHLNPLALGDWGHSVDRISTWPSGYNIYTTDLLSNVIDNVGLPVDSMQSSWQAFRNTITGFTSGSEEESTLRAFASDLGLPGGYAPTDDFNLDSRMPPPPTQQEVQDLISWMKKSCPCDGGSSVMPPSDLTNPTTDLPEMPGGAANPGPLWA